jgi:hypothetical protein
MDLPTRHTTEIIIDLGRTGPARVGLGTRRSRGSGRAKVGVRKGVCRGVVSGNGDGDGGGDEDGDGGLSPGVCCSRVQLRM